MNNNSIIIQADFVITGKVKFIIYYKFPYEISFTPIYLN